MPNLRTRTRVTLDVCPEQPPIMTGTRRARLPTRGREDALTLGLTLAGGLDGPWRAHFGNVEIEEERKHERTPPSKVRTSKLRGVDARPLA